MTNPLQAPPASPFRAAVDQLLEALMRGALSTLSPFERVTVTAQLRRRDWDLARLSRRGPLQGVSDEQLATLLSMLAERLDGLLEEGADQLLGPPTAEAQALEALRRALARG